MGRWCRVKCNCENREILEYHGGFDSYKCGHDDGAYIQFAPNDLFKIGYALEYAFDKKSQIFDVFIKIGNWREYDDEYLALTEEERDMWQLEIEELQKFLNEEYSMGWKETNKFHQYLDEDPLLSVCISKMSKTEGLDSTLKKGLSLIEASKLTGNPVELLW
jgi:hypothetical protein